MQERFIHVWLNDTKWAKVGRIYDKDGFANLMWSIADQHLQ